ncbi:hypothetical protein SAMN02745163_03996 [Clostridium cavendishii DSM 21758]|uniref:Polymerase/histidinol phosphatase N-terminal domain-containing protein n=1 Tax=Clostridium cavendishii DSM 21758 TaxID=1121302 RepID=A0A1M6TA30_9CLOT|nr:PHP domain-containing protein [Clostridium cavendishii]SHK53686.1 hypothetical protein SAMN02745163_03996 [Clostridium cavendishii DSM 21758]
MKELRADLHMHTRASDGTLTPKELIKQIIENNIDIFAVTDHDTIGSIEETRKLAKEHGKIFIPGVEISSLLDGEVFHILAYNFDENHKEFIDLIKNNEHLLEKKDDDSIKMLIEHGFDLDFEEYLQYEHNPMNGGWKTLNFLKEKGLCSNVNEFFTKIFVRERALEYPDFPHPKEVIEMIIKAGGVPILAHPRYGKSKFTLEETLENFKNWGVKGIECLHPHHNKDVINKLKEYCIQNNLIITGGSDYHGGLITERSLGYPEFYSRGDIFLK